MCLFSLSLCLAPTLPWAAPPLRTAAPFQLSSRISRLLAAAHLFFFIFPPPAPNCRWGKKCSRTSHPNVVHFSDREPVVDSSETIMYCSAVHFGRKNRVQRPREQQQYSSWWCKSLSLNSEPMIPSGPWGTNLPNEPLRPPWPELSFCSLRAHVIVASRLCEPANQDTGKRPDSLKPTTPKKGEMALLPLI